MSAEPDASPLANPPASLLEALRRLIRPLVRLLLDHRITWPTLASLFRETYVEMADREFGIEGKAQTTTRVSLLTGIHRKEVRRLRETDAAEQEGAAAATLGAQLVARWTGDPDYLDRRGAPRPLPRRGGAPSFETLVESVSKDIRARAVLDEWFRLGIVEADARDRIVLNRAAFVPERGFDEKVFFFGRNLGDHIETASRNLRGVEPPLLERSVFYDELREESVVELEALARQLGEDALAEINRRAFALSQRDAAEGDGQARMTFGVFFLRDEPHPAEEASDRDDD